MPEPASGLIRDVPVPALVALGVIVCCQLALQVFSLVDLARRQSVIHDRKWIWVIIIIGGQIIGPIVYLAYGRRVDDDADDQPATDDARERSRKALDVLYQRKDPR